MLKLLAQLFGFTSPLNLETIVESLEDAVLVLEKSNRLIYANQHWKKLTGTEIKPAYRRPFTEFIHPEDRVNWQLTLQKIEQNHDSQLLWIRIIDNTDHIHWCEIRIQPIFKHKLYPLSATVCDITPQIRSDQIKEARFRSVTSLINRIPAMIYRSRNNLNWTMEYVSDGCLELTGYEPEQMLNNAELSYGSLIHPDDQEKVWNGVQRALKEKTYFQLSYRLLHASGETRHVYEKGCAIYSDTGSVLGVEGVIFTLND